MQKLRNASSCTTLDRRDFNRLYLAQFSRVIDAASTNNVGNYAALSLDDNTAALGATCILPDTSMLTLKFSGTVEDGLSAIWSQRTVSGGVSADLQYHLPAVGTRLYISTDSCRAIELRKSSAEEEFKRKIFELEYRTDTIPVYFGVQKLFATNQKLVADSAKVRTERDALLKIPESQRSAEQQTRLLARSTTLDSLRLVLPIQTRELTVERERLVKLRELRVVSTIRQLGNQLARAKKAAVGPFSAIGGRYHWWSFGYGYHASKFRLYNDSVAFKDQVTKKSYGSHELRIQHSWYQRAFLTKVPAYFYTLALSAGVTDNHGDLDEVTLEDRTVQGPDSASRTLISNYKALTGAYQEGILTASIKAEAWFFLFRNQAGALHLFPSHTVTEGMTPSTDLGIGLFMGFANRDKAGTFLNAEIFFRFNDVANAAEEDNNAWKRSDLGLRFAFPFNFPQKQ